MRAPVRTAVLLVSLMVAALVTPTAAVADDVDRSQIFFPVQVQDSLQYSDTWGACRSGCSRSHLGVDIMSDQMTPVFAAQDGTIYAYEASNSSYYLLLDGDDGRMYFYVHLNNDTPGRPNGCDGAGGPENAFSPRLADALADGNLKGLRVSRGEHLGYTGSSGNAGCRVDHTHFEIWNGEGWDGHRDRSINPYPPVRAAQDAGNVWGPGWAEGDPVPSARVAGDTRIDTAVQLSRKAFPKGSDTVVIAPATYYQEALVSAPLASSVGAPVLLAWPDSNSTRAAITESVAAEVDRLGAEHAIVVGAARRIGNDVVDELVRKTGLRADDVRRIGDADPAVLSAEVAEVVLAAQGIDVPSGSRSSTEAAGVMAMEPFAAKADESRTAAAAGDQPDPVDPLIAAGIHPRGLGWPDALAASVLGSRQLAPVLLTPSDDLHPDVARVLNADGVRTARFVGGPLAIEESVDRQVERETTAGARRIAGEDRYDTSQKVQDEIRADGASLKTVALATGLNFPDALAAGPAMATLGRSFVLVDGANPHPRVQDWLSANASAIDRLEVIGGPDAIADWVLRQAAIAANGD